jgi:uncharacterized protein (TIGR02687 family)
MSEKIIQSLTAHFKAHRLVFWYDPEGSERELFESFAEPEIQKIELANDELAVKYRITRQEPEAKFLVYAPAARPAAEDNWLLDLELANFVFSTDKAAMIIQQLGVSPSLQKAIAARLSFFRSQAERVEPLADLASPEWTESELLYAMLSIASARNKKEREKVLPLDTILISLVVDNDCEERWRRIVEWKLDEIFYERIEEEYRISLDVPEPAGILLRLFTAAFAFQSEENRTAASRRAFLFIETWRERKSETERYESTARKMERATNAASRCAELSDELLSKIDVYPCADLEILARLSGTLSAAGIDTNAIAAVAKKRRGTYWYINDQDGRIKNWYDAIEVACQLEQSLAELRKGAPFRALSKKELWEDYTKQSYVIDQHYRSLLFNMRRAGYPPALASLLDRASKTYLNDFLSPLAQRWQSLLDADSALDFAPRQNIFFATHVARHLRDGKRVFVLISDALRWEAGCELTELLGDTGRFKVVCEPMAAVLPSYTSHGMAALLPHDSLAIDTSTGEVKVDGNLQAGIEGRGKLLAGYVSAKYPTTQACALSCDYFLSLSATEADEKLRNMGLVYLYSGRIDTAGHASDQGLPEAVDDELRWLVRIIKRIATVGRSQIIVTADHGFLYSGFARDDEYMLEIPPVPGETLRDQRFILGTSLKEVSGLMKIGSPEPAFSDKTTALIAKGLMKLRRKGASGNFIHGGATLQELAIPVIQVTPLKKNESRLVAVSVMGTKEITTPSIVVKLFQEEPVGGALLPHRIRAWFVSDSGESISNKAECLCDSTDTEDINRAYSLSLEFLSGARKYKGKKVFLLLHTVAEGGTLLPLEPVEYKLRQIALDYDQF